MKIILFRICCLLFIFNNSLNSVFSQTINDHPPFEIRRDYPYLSVAKNQLDTANFISDLKNSHNNLHLEYRSEWVEKYISVEIQVCQNGVIKKATGPTEKFTAAQKALLLSADPTKDVQINIHYWPQNNLVQKESKNINFTFSLDPEETAVFPGGVAALNGYFKKEIIHQLSTDSFQEYEMTAIKFSIGPTGQVQQVEPFGNDYQPEKFSGINQQLMTTVRNMPRWQPAAYTDGTSTSQNFVLIVGSTENCNLPLLNIDL